MIVLTGQISLSATAVLNGDRNFTPKSEKGSSYLSKLSSKTVRPYCTYQTSLEDVQQEEQERVHGFLLPPAEAECLPLQLQCAPAGGEMRSALGFSHSGPENELQEVS